MFKRLVAYFVLEVDRMPPEGKVELPNTLWRFVWYFARQAKPVLLAMLCLELVLAIALSAAFWYVGQLVQAGNYTPAMLWAGFLILCTRYVARLLLFWLNEIVFVPHFANMVRRQVFEYVSQHSLAFFQNDFAGRIGQKLLQSATSLRDALRSMIGAVWFVVIFTATNLWLIASVNFWLALPMFLWVGVYTMLLCVFLPKIRKRAVVHSENLSHLTGQLVDIFTNFLPVKYFAQRQREDRYVVALLTQHSNSFQRTTGMIAILGACLETANLLLLLSTGVVGMFLLQTGQVEAAALAMVLPMALQATFQSGWIMNEMSGIFENLGIVQEGIDTLTKPQTVTDAVGATDLVVTPQTAAVVYRNTHFHYGRTDGLRILAGFNLEIPAGQKLGVVGRSGAGKSTLTSLLVRAYDVESGTIRIAGQDISQMTQDSLRRAITVVTQESYLFHRSVRENITYGRPEATDAQVQAAAQAAVAHEFIQHLSDAKGRTGYAAHVGERGVKLSGGQKQRIAIARAILKNAPILVLDEATSALDSESEQAIQTALETVMAGKTVIAVAHRLSTLRQMDRIIVMDQGQIAEDGTHDTLVQAGGIYADLWSHQTGGYLPEEAA